MDKLLTWFIYGWVALAVLVNVVAIVGLFLEAGTFWGGVSSVQETYSPFNVLNWLLEVILISPAVGAYWWRERRKERADRSEV